MKTPLILSALAVGATLALSACASSRSLGESITDISADAQLKGVLLADRSHDYADIDLTVYEGTLLLTGTMRTTEGRDALIANAWKAGGVEKVIDEVVVGEKTSFGQGVEDSRIEAALRARFITDENVKSGDFKIAVSGGAVYLLGAARDAGQIARANEIASGLTGVSRVVSHVGVRTPA